LLISRSEADVALDPTDVGELQKALNDAAGKASIRI
jgi:hypothetical protein